MQLLPDPEIYDEFLGGNWVVNNNSSTPFCALGATNALEHINRSMKVSGGLVGITLNPSARAKLFLITPELPRLAEQAKSMAGSSSTMSVSHHYALTFAVLAREQKSIEQLLTTMESFTVITNPFNQDSGDLFDLVTKAVMLENVKKDVCEQSTTGRKFFQSFVKERTQEKTTFGPQLRNNSFSLRRQKEKSQTWRRQQLRGAGRRQEPVCKNDGCLHEATRG